MARFDKRQDPSSCSAQQLEQRLQPQVSPSQAKPGNSKTAPSMGFGPNPESLRILLYSIQGTDGPPNEALCNINSKPLHRVPVCAHRNIETTPAVVMKPCRFCKPTFVILLSFLLFAIPSPHNPTPIERQETPQFCCDPKFIFWDKIEKQVGERKILVTSCC